MFPRTVKAQTRTRRFIRATAVLAGSLFAGLAITVPAQAHTLSESQAFGVAARHADSKIRSVNNDYISYGGISCDSLFPHQVECRISFDNRATKPTRRYACTERILVYYKAHSEIPQSNPLKFYKHLTHEC